MSTDEYHTHISPLSVFQAALTVLSDNALLATNTPHIRTHSYDAVWWTLKLQDQLEVSEKCYAFETDVNISPLQFLREVNSITTLYSSETMLPPNEWCRQIAIALMNSPFRQ